MHMSIQNTQLVGVKWIFTNQYLGCHSLISLSAVNCIFVSECAYLSVYLSQEDKDRAVVSLVSLSYRPHYHASVFA